MIFATGYRYSYPFLPQYYDDATYEPHAGSAPTVSPFLPLDGSHIRDLYLDHFYIADPTLAFINGLWLICVSLRLCSVRGAVVLGVRSFILSEYTTLALAKVWTNKAKLPSTQTMRALHERTVEERGGYNKYFLFWGPGRSTSKSMHSFLI